MIRSAVVVGSAVVVIGWVLVVVVVLVVIAGSSAGAAGPARSAPADDAEEVVAVGGKRVAPPGHMAIGTDQGEPRRVEGLEGVGQDFFPHGDVAVAGGLEQDAVVVGLGTAFEQHEAVTEEVERGLVFREPGMGGAVAGPVGRTVDAVVVGRCGRTVLDADG